MRKSEPLRKRKTAELGHDHVNGLARCQRERAFTDELTPAARRRGGHRHDHAPGADDEIHRAAHAQHVLPGHGPVGDVAPLAHLEGAEDGDVHVAAADHREARRAVEVRRARERGDRLLGGVDEVGVELVLGGARPDAEQAVLGVEEDLRLCPEVARNEVGDADAEVHDLSGPQLLRGPGGDQRLGVGAAHALATRWST